MAQPSFNQTHIAANGTTTIASGPGVLHSLVINTKGAAANTITIWDNTVGSGTKIAAIDSTAGIGTILYDVIYATGLTVVLATGTAADITVTWA